ncbi:nitrous oxide-stimulated promoter family protein [Chloroflexota bacterium]
MTEKRPRIARETRTVEVMIGLYCHDHHEGDDFCSECSELLDYTRKRLDKCIFQEGKTTCAGCPVHCFNPAIREKIRAVMRYAGPRMAHRHPVLTLFHFIDGRRKEPVGYCRKTDGT